MFSVSKAECAGSFDDIVLHSPFPAKSGSVRSLHNVLSDERSIRLVFNDDVQSTFHPNLQDQAKYIEFSSGRGILLVPMGASHTDDPHKIRLRFSVDGVAAEDWQRMEKENGRASVYSRIRFAIDRSAGSSNIHIHRSAISQKMLCDFRFKEFRILAESSETYRDSIPMNYIQLFIIMPESYSITLNQQDVFRYVRMLERGSTGWESYIPELARHKDPYLVYYWKKEFAGICLDPFDMIAIFTEENGGVLQQLLVSLVLLAMSSIFGFIAQHADIADLLGGTADYAKIVFTTVAGVVFVIMLGVLTNALYDVGKSLWSNWSKK